MVIHMRVRVFQHIAFEGIGSMETWLRERDADVQFTCFYDSPTLPDPDKIDLLIVMGGPMSVNDDIEYPWLREEKGFIGEVIRRGIAVIGVCLGAQLIAAALGARVYSNHEKEIGWFPIEWTSSDNSSFNFPARPMVFHWHGETFDLPSGATLLATSAGCRNQAFQVGENVIGMQFHLETTPETADLLIQNCRHELVSGKYIQPEARMRAEPEASYAAINLLSARILSCVTKSQGQLT